MTTLPGPSPVAELFARSRSVIVDDAGSVAAPDLVVDGARWAAQWRSAGLAPGDRVGLWLANGRTYLRALLACATGGYVAVSVNTRWSPTEAGRLLTRCGATALVCDREPAGLDPHPAPVPDFDPAAAPLDRRQWALPDQPFLVVTTSGTTSEPKMVLHRQRSIADHAPAVAASFGYRTDGPVAVVMPLCGVFGLASLTGAVAGGAPIFLPPGVDPPTLARLIEAERITALNGSDDLFHRLLATDADLSSVGAGGYARFNTSLDDLVERADARQMALVGLYGMSEVQALFAHRAPQGHPGERRRAGGVAVDAGAEARVVDGELQLRGPSLFAGYLAEGGERIDDDLTAAAFTADGWFRTGDGAEIEPPVDGRAAFTYTARLGDVLRLGGFLVAPTEIESVILELDGIDEVQVVAVDRASGARPVAFITGDHPPSAEAVIERCRSRLARYKCPVLVVHLDSMPTTPSANGTKIQRVKLREWGAERLAHLSPGADA